MIYTALIKDLFKSTALVFMFLIIVAFFCQFHFELGDLFLWKVILVFLAGSFIVITLATRFLSTQTFGLANKVTLIRWSLVALLFGLVGDYQAPWLVVLISSTVLVLDGVDGWIARYFQLANDFGARFDMETDAILLLIISVLVWQYDKAGVWILFAGFLRYIYVVLGYFFPVLLEELPPSRRRQAAFIVQAVALIISISPITGQLLSNGIALTGLLLLISSFATDVNYLIRSNSDLSS